MALTAFALEMVALWFQHVMGLKPCVLCIYERCALFGIMGAAWSVRLPLSRRFATWGSPSGCTARGKGLSCPGSTP